VTLAAGTRLGPYEILSPLGAGGMGEVYRARDTRLERTVAIKVLPQHLSSSPEVRQRFEREAKTISQLSHPHICALYDVGNQDGVEFLVMEYLEGETLSEPTTIPRGKLLAVGIGYSMTTPPVVILPILLALNSVNQRAPSGPAARNSGRLPAVGSGNSLID
jgi:serine/threonine protein kinase